MFSLAAPSATRALLVGWQRPLPLSRPSLEEEERREQEEPQQSPCPLGQEDPGFPGEPWTGSPVQARHSTLTPAVT